jgi:flagellar hook-length control protein FliK
MEPLAAITSSAVPATFVPDHVEALIPKRPDLDAAIPPLKLATTNDVQLPYVELPTLKVDGAETKVDGAALRNAHTATLKVEAAAAKVEAAAAKIEAVAPKLDGDVAFQPVTASEAPRPADNQSGVAAQKNTSAFVALNNPSHAGGFSPTQLVSAAQPISIIPTHGYVNHAPVTEQVHVAVKKAAADGIERMTIQLDPLELGRVEISMQTNRDGQTSISFLVDKASTFDSLSRDARMLERSLQEAGIKSDTGSMQFNLRQPPQTPLHSDLGGQGQRSQEKADSADDTGASSKNIATITPMDGLTRNYLFNVRDGVDISA